MAALLAWATRAIDDECRRDLDPGRQLVVQRSDRCPLGRVGRQVLDLGQEPVVHDPQVDGADLVERQTAVTIGQLAGDAAAGDLESERDLERTALVEPVGIGAQPVELGSHEREGRLRPDPAQEDHPSRSASASSPASPAIRRSAAGSAPMNVQPPATSLPSRMPSSGSCASPASRRLRSATSPGTPPKTRSPTTTTSALAATSSSIAIAGHDAVPAPGGSTEPGPVGEDRPFSRTPPSAAHVVRMRLVDHGHATGRETVQRAHEQGSPLLVRVQPISGIGAVEARGRNGDQPVQHRADPGIADPAAIGELDVERRPGRRDAVLPASCRAELDRGHEHRGQSARRQSLAGIGGDRVPRLAQDEPDGPPAGLSHDA